MINKQQTEQILRLNGIEPDAPPEEIRTVLIRARWHKDDVDAAIAALNRAPDEITVEHNHSQQLTHSDASLAPETLNAVLGVDIELTEVRQQRVADQNWFLRKQIISMLLVAVLGAVLFIITIMWQLKLSVSDLIL